MPKINWSLFLGSLLGKNVVGAVGSVPASAPINIIVTNLDGGVSVTFDSVATATLYVIRYGFTTGIYDQVPIADNGTTIFIPLAQGTDIFFIVEASNAVGSGPTSPEQTGRSWAYPTLNSIALSTDPAYISDDPTITLTIGNPDGYIINQVRVLEAGIAITGWDAVAPYTLSFLAGLTVGVHDITVEIDVATVGIIVSQMDQFEIFVDTSPSFTSAAIFAVNVNDPYLYSVTFAEGTGNTTVTLTAPILPSWLTFVGGVLSGTPNEADLAASPHAVTLRLDDSVNPVVDQVFFIAISSVAPSIPGGLVGIGGAGIVDLSWTASPLATSYEVEYALVSGGPYTAIAGITGLTYQIAGITSLTQVYFRVRAHNLSGASAYSAEVTATTTDTETFAGSLITVNAGNTTAEITWSNPPAELNPLNVEIRVGLTPAATTVHSTVAYNVIQPHVLTGLTNGLDQYINLVWIDIAGNRSAPSNELSVVPDVLTGTAPTTPTIIAFPIANRLNWNHITDDEVVGYEIQRQVNVGGFSLLATSRYPWYNDKAVSVGQAVDYKVRTKYERVFDNLFFRKVETTYYSGYTALASNTVTDADNLYYVDPVTGLDSNNGAIGTPFKTIQKASDVAVVHRETDTQSTRVVLRAGTYRHDGRARSTALSYTADDSGEKSLLTLMQQSTVLLGKDKPITFEAFPAETVIINGADDISGSWTDRSGDIGTGVWSKAWGRKFGIRPPQSATQGIYARTRNNVFYDGVRLTEYVPTQTWAFTWDGALDAPAALTQQSVAVSSIVGAPYVGQDGHIDMGDFEFTLNTGEEILLTGFTGGPGAWFASITRGKNQSPIVAQAAGSAESLAVATTGDTTATVAANEGSILIDEANDTAYLRIPAGKTNPNVDVVEVAVCRETIKFSGQDNLTFTNIKSRYTCDWVNDGSSAQIFGASSSEILLDTCEATWANYTGVNIVGDQAEVPASAISNVNYVDCNFDDAGGQPSTMYHCRLAITDNCTGRRSNWRGALGNWFQWNVGWKMANQCHLVFHVNCTSSDGKADGYWFDLDGEWVYIEDNDIMDCGRYAMFAEASRANTYIRRNRMVGNADDADVVVTKGAVTVNMTSNNVVFEDNLIDGLGVTPRCFRLSGDDRRVFVTGWDSQSNIYHAPAAIVAIDAVAGTFAVTGDISQLYLDYVHTIPHIQNSTNNNSDLISDGSNPASIIYDNTQTPTYDSVLNRTTFYTLTTLNDTIIDGEIVPSFDFIAYDWTFRRNYIAGITDVIFNHQFVSSAYAQTFYQTLQANYNIYDLSDGALFGGHEGEDTRKDFATWKAYLATGERAVSWNDDESVDLAFGAFDVRQAGWVAALETFFSPATPLAPTSLAIATDGVVTWTDPQYVNVIGIDVAVGTTANPTIIAAQVPFGTEQYQLIIPTGIQHFVRVRVVTDKGTSAWTADSTVTIVEAIVPFTETTYITDSASFTTSPDATYLIIRVINDEGAASSVTGITYGGQALTKLGEALQTFQCSASIWYLETPPSGANTYIVTRTQGVEILVHVGDYKNIRATSIIEGVAIVAQRGVGATAYNNDITIALTYDTIIDAIGHTVNEAIVATHSPDQEQSVADGNIVAGFSRLNTNAAGTYNLGWTGVTNPAWAHCIVALVHTQDSLASAPTSFTIDRAASTEVSVVTTWVDPLGSIDYISVLRDGIEIAQVAGGVQTYTDATAITGAEYIYTTKAFFVGGTESVATADEEVFMKQVTGVTAVGAAGTIDWNGITVVGATMYRCLSGLVSGTYTAANEEPTLPVGQPVGSAETWFGVLVPIGPNFEGIYSTEASATSLDTEAPNPPVIGIITVTDANTLSVPYTADGDVTHVRLHRSLVSGGPYTIIKDDTVGALPTPLVDTGLVVGTAYYYNMTGRDAAGNWSSLGVEKTATTTAYTNPSLTSISTVPVTVYQGDLPIITFNVVAGTDAITSVQGFYGGVIAATAIDSATPFAQVVLEELIQAETIEMKVNIVTAGLGPFMVGSQNLVINILTAPILVQPPDPFTIGTDVVTAVVMGGASPQYLFRTFSDAGLTTEVSNSGFQSGLTWSPTGLLDAVQYWFTVQGKNGSIFTAQSAAKTTTAQAAPSGITGPNDVSWAGNANLAYAFCADNLVYNDAGITLALNGETVQQWNDLKTSSIKKFLQGTSTLRSILRTNDINANRNVLEFDGVDDNFQLAVQEGFSQTGATVFFVMKQAASAPASNNLTPIAWHNNLRVIWSNGAANFQLRRKSDFSSDAIGSFSGAHLCTLIYNSASDMDIRYDGVDVVTAVNPDDVTPTVIYLGTNTSAGNDCPIKMAYVIVVNAALSGVGLTDMEAYLKTYYGIV